ncbi:MULTISPECIES: NupC/NupG family nucleoside CNT transporter [unclassified Roseofilum]|uniref:NupC/NupG family nucleoside CNT transporter n=1 Tax=unclassified Roseofilum TaxID=2620099 RepID=UPI000E7FB2FC|nr:MULTISPECIES: NupC/NupG family nucleoside CNT transporter [unclassified Roseofilum]HBQ99100.1 NupC/NupG family nucleoside CNT transporter [Cyanobacteria bacterium UBA11691]MBP0008894.1 NupC/NupG family nucleoside CNT transporter [Roseofilum sp. Belize Diploria]MBP0013868.1 NupC/NupG family nucleoside CNT transporter [Roseofilum sp. SID3]MBP0024721.1 NupC/NupG family nucleoside CNT transporter [Roseofilum sp. SID2]MBP0033069.1 NupC/NupG family nucleoside CNT transporter [Roseofilum sp. Beliz
MERVISLLGLGVFVAFAYGISVNRPAVRWRVVAMGLGLQFVLAVLILKVPFGLALFRFLGDRIQTFLEFSDVGSEFVFSSQLVNNEVYIFAFRVLPTVIFFSAFISVLYYYGILPRMVQAIARFMQYTLKTSGSETLTAAANIFVGSTEAPLLIKPYVSTTTRSELHAIMTSGFSTVAGGVLVAYISFGIAPEHLITASVMSAPAALAISKLMYPETESSPTMGTVSIQVEKTSINAIDALSTGASEGMKLALNIAAMLIAFLGVLAFINAVLGWMGGLVGLPTLSLEGIFGVIFAPVAWLMGVPWADCLVVGELLGKKTILTEFIAYVDLSELIANQQISDRTAAIATYALCGFSNLGAIGIQLGGIGAIAPSRQSDLAQLGLRAMIGGFLACCMTACIAGVLL